MNILEKSFATGMQFKGVIDNTCVICLEGKQARLFRD